MQFGGKGAIRMSVVLLITRMQRINLYISAIQRDISYNRGISSKNSKIPQITEYACILLSCDERPEICANVPHSGNPLIYSRFFLDKDFSRSDLLCSRDTLTLEFNYD